ncbi:putative protein N(5)-glutamine methyltransferase [Arthrobacter sp. LAPM80]|uniref:putative protein N(5)-glutamine methyltransferase n=1 Tax=Arthrobacter sp. LAPM80 TaxID=3141788 RepID=UPI00398A9B89
MEQSSRPTTGELVAALRAAGCVYAEEEAAILADAAGSTADLALMLARRVQGFPLEHIVGWARFYGMRIAVAPGVFVPRRRSEFLVDQALAALKSRPGRADPPRILDLCCGSGAVGAALAETLDKKPAGGDSGCELHGTDIDQAAVDCAAGNVAPFDGYVYCGDLFAPIPVRLRGSFDLIVANAPYVPSASIAFMPQEARIHEPEAALNGGADGLELHRRIAADAPRWLRPHGRLLLECSIRQAPVSAGILTTSGFSTSISTSEELDDSVVTGRLGSGLHIGRGTG